jgi:cob(I)alamin adenosyltransferase
LTRVAELGAEGLEAARQAVRRLERRAYRISEVYQATEPARPGAPVGDD